MLREQHDVWIRSTITSIAFELPDTDLVIQRLLRIPKDFEQIFETYYGRTITAKFNDLFKEHLDITIQLAKAAKANNNDEFAEVEQRWYQNADEIAAFLAGINYFWPSKEWRKMLHEHLGLVKAEIVNILAGNYEDGIVIYDKIEKQTLGMVDEMVKGLFKQFPNRFVK
ncbi:MAG: acetylglutamate kinase [Peptococcaceae bacterium]|nr:acetylglutamate kinase [Peptococcaceae bacterium]